MIALSHAEHIDSQINDHYRPVAGASRFLDNIVQFPGSATFYGPASYLASDVTTGRVAGMTLSSFVADDVPHIAEICVVPDARGTGLGYELLRQSVATLRGAGAKRVSLTVTAANEEAVGLYTRCGFPRGAPILRLCVGQSAYNRSECLRSPCSSGSRREFSVRTPTMYF